MQVTHQEEVDSEMTQEAGSNRGSMLEAGSNRGSTMDNPENFDMLSDSGSTTQEEDSETEEDPVVVAGTSRNNSNNEPAIGSVIAFNTFMKRTMFFPECIIGVHIYFQGENIGVQVP